MQRTLKRLLMALALSIGCLSGSLYFAKQFKQTKVQRQTSDPIAFARSINEEVERKQSTRLVWMLLNEGEPLFPGESIKTSELGEVRIQFANSERYIDLEPDSMIVIKQAAGNEISLDLMGGSLFVSQAKEGESSATLTLNSEQGKIDLSQASAQLSKSSGNKLDVQVLKGKAKVESNGKTQELDASKRLSSVEILSPSLDKDFFINPENPTPVTFKWKGFSANSNVQLWTGTTRKNLKLLKQGSVTDSTLVQAFKPGRHFWKLVALDQQTQKSSQESAVFSLKVVARYAPTGIAPAVDSQVLKESPEAVTEFKWSRPDGVKSVYLEISTDQSFAKDKVVFSKNFFEDNTHKENLKEGNYFFRIAGSYDDIDKPLMSRTYPFKVVSTIKPPPPPVVIGWINPLEGEPQYYVKDPLAQFAWTSGQKDQVKIWRLKLAENEELLKSESSEQVVSIDTNDLQAKTAVQKPGRYIAMVEALDENQKVLAKSDFKSIEVAPLPLLKAPQLQPSDGELLADNDGRLNLKWLSLSGAKEYWITLYDSSGKELRKAKFNGTSTALVNLLPGKYKVSIHAIDQHGRESERLSPRDVEVPESSNLGAPKLKKIQVN